MGQNMHDFQICQFWSEITFIKEGLDLNFEMVKVLSHRMNDPHITSSLTELCTDKTKDFSLFFCVLTRKFLKSLAHCIMDIF